MHDDIGKTSFFLVVRVGKKYIYGKHIYLDRDNNDKKVYNWDDDVNAENFVIFDGIRKDIEQIWNHHKKDLEDYQKRKDNAEYEIRNELRQLEDQKREAWQKANPRPEPIDLTSFRK